MPLQTYTHRSHLTQYLNDASTKGCKRAGVIALTNRTQLNTDLPQPGSITAATALEPRSSPRRHYQHQRAKAPNDPVHPPPTTTASSQIAPVGRGATGLLAGCRRRSPASTSRLNTTPIACLHRSSRSPSRFFATCQPNSNYRLSPLTSWCFATL
jgi:hypothetical protein